MRETYVWTRDIHTRRYTHMVRLTEKEGEHDKEQGAKKQGDLKGSENRLESRDGTHGTVYF